jgi:hypothetical protein
MPPHDPRQQNPTNPSIVVDIACTLCRLGREQMRLSSGMSIPVGDARPTSTNQREEIFTHGEHIHSNPDPFHLLDKES